MTHSNYRMVYLMLLALFAGMALASAIAVAGAQKYSPRAIDDSIMAEFMADRGYSDKEITRLLALPRTPEVDFTTARWVPGEVLRHSDDLAVVVVFKVPDIQGTKIYDLRSKPKR